MQVIEQLVTADAGDRPFLRYFSTTNLFNEGLSRDELATYQYGLSKLVNSLSWNAKIANPTPVDEHVTIFRIDLRDYNWVHDSWELIIDRYPYVEFRILSQWPETTGGHQFA